MKRALLVGCGSKFGLNLLEKLLDLGWEVYSISSSVLPERDRLKQLTVDWATVNVATTEHFLRSVPDVDLVFFNQNGSSLSEDSFLQQKTMRLWQQEQHWAQSYFVSCILPYHIIQTLGSKCSGTTKVGWMLSSYIYSHTSIEYADYIGNKYQNYILMRNFSLTHPSCFFGVNPDMESGREDFISTITSDTCNFSGKVIKFNGSVDTNFEKFN